MGSEMNGRRAGTSQPAGRVGPPTPPPQAASRIHPRRFRTDAPLSFAQQRMWFFNQLEPASALYNRARASRWRGPLDLAVLERGLTELVRRHEILRARFPLTDRGVVQEVAPAAPVRLPLREFREGSRLEQEEAAQGWMLAEAARSFDLTREQPFRAFLARLGAEEHLLLLVIHHIASDRWSRRVLLDELVMLYEGLSAGRDPLLPELPAQYGDFAAWQQEHFQSRTLEREVAYWRQRLEGAIVLDLPADRPRPATPTYAGAQVSFPLPEELVQAVGRLARAERATPFVVLLTGFAILLARSTRQTDLIIGVPVACRVRPELESMIGCFTNTLPVRVDLTGDATFRETVRRVRQLMLGDLDHQELPFEKLVEELDPPRSPGRHPLFQVLFNYLSFPHQALEGPGLRVEDIDIDLGMALLDLAVELKRGPAGWVCYFTYSRDLFEASTISRLAHEYQGILEGAITEPERRLSSLFPPGAPEPDESERLFLELERLSDEEAERLLAAELRNRTSE